MPDPQQGRELTQADQHIAETEQRIYAQMVRLARLTTAGHDPTEAAQLLEFLRECLVLLRIHRQLIVEAIA
jgi:hypothetical protein